MEVTVLIPDAVVMDIVRTYRNVVDSPGIDEVVQLAAENILERYLTPVYLPEILPGEKVDYINDSLI